MLPNTKEDTNPQATQTDLPQSPISESRVLVISILGVCLSAIGAVLASVQANVYGWIAIALGITGAFLLMHTINFQKRLLAEANSKANKLQKRQLEIQEPQVDHTAGWQRCLNELSFDWYWETDKNGAIKYHEGTGALQMGYITKEDIGKQWWDFESLNMSEHDWSLHRETVKQEKKYTGLELGRRTETGAEYWICLSAMPRYVNKDGKRTFVGYCGIAQIITDYKTAQQKIQQVSVTDTLTGLPNRPFFLSLLPSVISKAMRQNSRALLIIININNFSRINLELGIMHADELLIQFAHRLKNQIRDTDVIARLEGDAFAVLMEGISGDLEQATQITEKIVEKLKTKAQEPYAISTFAMPIVCSVRCGIALYEQKDNASKLMSRAHDALAQQKPQVPQAAPVELQLTT